MALNVVEKGSFLDRLGSIRMRFLDIISQSCILRCSVKGLSWCLTIMYTGALRTANGRASLAPATDKYTS